MTDFSVVIPIHNEQENTVVLHELFSIVLECLGEMRMCLCHGRREAHHAH
jgi:hypothetical protein